MRSINNSLEDPVPKTGTEALLLVAGAGPVDPQCTVEEEEEEVPEPPAHGHS